MRVIYQVSSSSSRIASGVAGGPNERSRADQITLVVNGPGELNNATIGFRAVDVAAIRAIIGG
jgi:hypothetical protein